jgi:aspartate/methionine/tyrosine aminotransferase
VKDQTPPIDPIADPDAAIRAASPALWAALSPLGRRVRQGANFLPLQTAEARGKAFNATIGQITDGHGRAVPLPPMAAALSGLDDGERSRAFLYSPVEGLADLRNLWRSRQRHGQPDGLPSSLPVVTVGPAQALALAAELFVVEGRAVALREPVRDEERELLETRLGGRLLAAPMARSGRFDPTALTRRLDGLPDGDPAVVLLRFPPRSGGFIPHSRERTSLRQALAQAADRRPLVVLVDDTWEVMETERSPSLFWRLLASHPNLIPVKIDGADGAAGFPGGRIGFLTFPFPPESGIARALESKVKMLLRAAAGSPSAASQVLVLRGLTPRTSGI